MFLPFLMEKTRKFELFWDQTVEYKPFWKRVIKRSQTHYLDGKSRLIANLKQVQKKSNFNCGSSSQRIDSCSSLCGKYLFTRAGRVTIDKSCWHSSTDVHCTPYKLPSSFFLTSVTSALANPLPNFLLPSIQRFSSVVRYGGESYAYAYALCPMPYEHLMLLRKAIIQHKNLFSVQKPGLLKKPGFSALVFLTDNCQLPSL